jgi:hypothetical protein
MVKRLRKGWLLRVRITPRLRAESVIRPPSNPSAMAGLYGDLQGIAGRSLLEIEGLEMPMLDGPAGIEAAE